MKRILKELTDIVSHPPSARIKVFPNADDMSFWKALMIGPPGSSYNHGVCMLSIQFPSQYPFKAPKVKFVTPIYHCNVSQTGKICMDVLLQNWSPAMTISKVLLALDELMLNPNPTDALDSTIASFMIQNYDVYKEKAINHAKTNANKRVDDLMIDILGNKSNMDLKEYNLKKLELENWIKTYKDQEKK